MCGIQIQMQRIHWIFLGPLNLTNVGVQDGGKYTCRLVVKLRHIKEYIVEDTTVIKSKYNTQLC